jgi:hypothetical protein
MQLLMCEIDRSRLGNQNTLVRRLRENTRSDKTGCVEDAVNSEFWIDVLTNSNFTYQHLSLLVDPGTVNK